MSQIIMGVNHMNLNKIAILISNAVTVYRGMNGISKIKLQKMIGVIPGDSGHVSINDNISLSEMGWWSDRIGVALTYASTDSVRGRKNGYDVLLKGVVDNTSDGPISHFLRTIPDMVVHVTDIYYAMPIEGNRRKNLEKLIGND